MMFSFRSWPPVTRLAALSACLLAVACAVAPKPAPPVPPAAAIPIAPPQFNSGDSRFDAFLMEARKEALAEGIAPATFDRATAGLRPIPEIVNMNANQPEFARPVWAYLDTAVSARRVRDARLMLDRYGAVLDRIEAQSGVPKEILVAIWGIETDYGAATGSYPLFAALATLAYRGPRADYARPEFLAALKIYQQQNYALSQMTGSWAGAFGQTQFTPTTFLKFAADGDGDGRIDLWNSPADALASAGRLLCERGWETGEPWGYEVRLPKNFSYELADGETARPVATWQELGVTTATGDWLPSSTEDAAIDLPAGAKGPAFLLFPNFRVILKYNNATSYALAVGLLADRMAGAAPVRHSWPRKERPLSREERVRFQQALAAQGFDPGPADGILGRATRAALRRYQKAHGLPADGFPTAALLAMMDKAVQP
ncbi:MAG TPA: lytic murein transglycosylase [Rhizomicrobium sp.]|jgi:membrane-bound lytic murein transglycosylase B|nr:lytic murein transglycosylase [Rhizomicrobium sp.]